MLEDYDRTLPYRLGFAALFFLTMGIRDWIKNPQNPTRVHEYCFLLTSMLLWVAYGIMHDHITATISPEYFLHAKQLSTSPYAYRISVTLLAAKATYGPGAIVGALLLIANNPSPHAPQLPYRKLFQYCVYAVLMAMLTGIGLGLMCSFFGGRTVLRELAADNYAQDRQLQFMLVWGIHAGSYLGAFLGSVLVTVFVVRRRKSKKHNDLR